MTVPKDILRRLGLFALLGLAGLFTVLSVTASASRHKSHQDLAQLLERYQITDSAEDDQQAQGPAKDPAGKDNQEKQEKPKSAHQDRADRINKRSFFAPPKPKDKFAAKLLGVLGRQAHFQGDKKAYEVGQTHKGGKITQIGPDWVEVDFKGATQKVYVFGKGGGGNGSASAPAPFPGSKHDGPRPGRSSPDGPTMPPGFELTPEMIERFKNMPAEMRGKALERMPEEIRKKLQAEL